MSFSDALQLYILNSRRMPEGKDLLTYGQRYDSTQDDMAARMSQMFNQRATKSQERGIFDYMRDLAGGTLKGVTGFARTGIDMLDTAGQQVGINSLGKKVFANTLGNVVPGALVAEYMLGKSGKSLSDVITKTPEWIASNPNSGVFQAGDVIGQVGSALLGTGVLTGAARAANIGQKALQFGKFATTAGDLGAAAVVNSAMQGIADWEQFDKESGVPGARMSGAEYLTRMGMSALTGTIAAPLNPQWGKLANVGFDALVGAATQGALEGASYAAANEARRKEIESTYLQNIGMSAAMNSAIGLGVRGLQRFIGGAEDATSNVQNVAEPAAPSQPAALPVAEAAVTQPAKPAEMAAATYAQQEEQLISNVRQWASGLSPDNLEFWRVAIGADEPTPESLAEKMRVDIASVDPNKNDFSRAAEWVDGRLGQDWHPKGSGYVIPEPGAEATATSPAVPSESLAPSAPSPIVETLPAADQLSQPALPLEPQEAVSNVRQTAQAVASEMSKKQLREFAKKNNLPATAQDVTAHLANPYNLTLHVMENVNQSIADRIAEALGIPNSDPPAVLNGILAEIAKDPKYAGLIESEGKSGTFSDEMFEAITTKSREILRSRAQAETPQTGETLITGEPYVQPRPEDINVSEPGQREPIAGEPPAQAIEPSPIQQEEAAPSTRAEDQAQEVNTQSEPLEVATTPITEPIAGEPYATQEGQVTEGGQPEYLGVPQRENIQENIGEVRQEEGGRPGDSGSIVEGGQEQAAVTPTAQQAQVGDVARSLLDMEAEVASTSGAMSDDVRAFLSGESISRGLGGRTNPLRPLIQTLDQISDSPVPDARVLKRGATKNEDGSLSNLITISSNGVPIADLHYYKESGNPRAQITITPSKNLADAIDSIRQDAIEQASKEEFGVSPDIAELFDENAAIGMEEIIGTPEAPATLATESKQAKRQRKFAEDKQEMQLMREIYSSKLDDIASMHDLPRQVVDDGVAAYEKAIANGASDIEVLESMEWENYVNSLSDDQAESVQSMFINDIIEAVEAKKQYGIQAEVSASLAPVKTRKRRMTPGQTGLRFDEGAAKASLGLAPGFATAGLDDEEEYVFGLKGSTIKWLALTAGGGVFLHNRMSKSPMFGLGANVTGPTSERTTWFQALRNNSSKQKLTRAIIERNVRNYAAVFGLSEESIQQRITKDLADHAELERIPRLPGMRGITALKILGAQVKSKLPARLSEAAYKGRAIGERQSIPIKLAQKAFEQLPSDRQVNLGQLFVDVDYATTKYINEQTDFSTSNIWTPEAQNVLKNITDVANSTVSKAVENLRKTNSVAADNLLADWNAIDPLYDDVRRAYFDMVAYEQTGTQSIEEGFKKYNKIVEELDGLVTKHIADAKESMNSGTSAEVLKAKSSAIRGLNDQLLVAKKMRNSLGDIRNQRAFSIARKYIPRWFDIDGHEFRVRVKQTATDVGWVRSFETADQMRGFLEEMNAPLTDKFRKTNGIPDKHPINDTPINTLAEFYQMQGGIVEPVTNKFYQSKLVEASADQMALREALEALSDSVQDGGEISAERFKQFLNVYGDDISKMVTASELQDIGVSSAKIDQLTNSRGKISAATIRRLVNSIAVPRNVDNTMHRTNVRGYAPEAISGISNQPNALYDRQMSEFISNGFNYFLSRTKSRAESASLRREINAQIIDLTGRGIAPNYVETLARLSSGLRWKPTPMASMTGKRITATKIDENLASFGAFKMMAGNVPSAVKNVFMGFVNTATQLPFETKGRLGEAIKLGFAGETAYWRMLAQDKVVRGELAAHLRSPMSLQTVDEQIARALKGDDALRATWIMAREAGAFEAKFYQSLERIFSAGAFDPKKNPRLAKAFEYAALPQVMAEHHNRGAAFMTGAMISLKEVPGDVERAFARGLEFQGITQGNFNNYNKSSFERKLLEVPGSRSFLLLSNAALRSSEQLGAHFVAAAMRPTHWKVWAPILAFTGTSLVFTGLLGAPILADAYKAVDFFGSLYEKDDESLNAIKESRPEAWTRKAGEMAQSLGFDKALGEWVMQNMLLGTSSVITGKNFSTENAVMNFATQFPPPGLSSPKAFLDYMDKFGSMQPRQRWVEGTGLFNVEAGRIARSLAQIVGEGKMGKSGDIVTSLYTVPQAIGDVAFGSNLDEALYGTSKRGGGGRLYFEDQANNYMTTVSGIAGLKLEDIHYLPFYEKVKGIPEQQAVVEAINRFRDLNIANYNSLAQDRKNMIDVWRGISNDPENRKLLVRIAMEGQQGSKLSNEPAEFLAGAEKKIDNYYLALAVQQSYAQLGVPPPKYKYQEADPMLPVWKYIDSKIRRGQLQFDQED